MNPVESQITRSPHPLAAVPGHEAPDVSFVFVTFGTGRVVIDAIVSLVASLRADDFGYEVIVVDNEHDERPTRTSTQLLLDTSGVAMVRPGRNLGFGGGCNAGAERARGAIVAFVNPDVEFRDGWLAPLVGQLATAAIAAPVLVNADGSVQSAGHRLFADASTEPILDSPAPGEAVSVDYASAACWVMLRSTFDDLGRFDESFFPAYYEDVDLALRARRAGGTVVVGDSTVAHHHGSSTTSTVVPDTTPQRDRLVEKWPELAATQPAPRQASSGGATTRANEATAAS